MRSEGGWLSILGIDTPRKEESSLQIGLTKSLPRPLNSSRLSLKAHWALRGWAWIPMRIATPGCRQNIYKSKCKDVKPHVSYHNNKTQLPISQQNTSSNTAYAEKNINQHPQNAYEKPTRASEMPTPALHKTYFV